MHKVNVSIPKFVSFVSVDVDFYSDIRFFSAANSDIRRRLGGLCEGFPWRFGHWNQTSLHH